MFTMVQISTSQHKSTGNPRHARQCLKHMRPALDSRLAHLAIAEPPVKFDRCALGFVLARGAQDGGTILRSRVSGCARA